MQMYDQRIYLWSGMRYAEHHWVAGEMVLGWLVQVITFLSLVAA